MIGVLPILAINVEPFFFLPLGKTFRVAFILSASAADVRVNALVQCHRTRSCVDIIVVNCAAEGRARAQEAEETIALWVHYVERAGVELLTAKG